jgi:hypothetical protein
MSVRYKLDLVDILHLDDQAGVFDVETRCDTAAVEVLHNESLEISYLNRPGKRTTSRIVAVTAKDPVGCGIDGVFVETRNSVYCFHAVEGKFDDREIVDRLNEDLATMRSLNRALEALVSAFA